jgi:hypothetical protein
VVVSVQRSPLAAGAEGCLVRLICSLHRRLDLICVGPHRFRWGSTRERERRGVLQESCGPSESMRC